MILCPLIALAVLGIAYFKIHKRSSKLETGLPGALGYGFLGYLWQYLIFSFLAMYLLALVFKGVSGIAQVGGIFRPYVSEYGIYDRCVVLGDLSDK